MKIFLPILTIPVFILFIFVAYFIIADWPVNFCKRMTDVRELCLTNPPQFSEKDQIITHKYAQEFQAPKQAEQGWVIFPDAPEESLKIGQGAGYVHSKTGAQFIYSSSGCSATKGCTSDDGKNLYVRLTQKDSWEQISIPDGGNIGSAYWITQNGSPKIFTSLYSLERRGIFDRKPSPFYLYDPFAKSWSYLFWGWDERISPYHKKILIKRGYDREFFSYYVWDVDTDTLAPLFMIQEKHIEYEPIKWDIVWSDDSKAINFVGETKQLGKFNFFYHIPSGKTYRIL